jgi:hypothetical protein
MPSAYLKEKLHLQSVNEGVDSGEMKAKCEQFCNASAYSQLDAILAWESILSRHDG